MKQALAKAFKWFFICIGIVLGTSAMMIAEETGSMRPVMFILFGYGFSYVIGSLWKDLREKLLAWSIVVFVFCTIASAYLDDAVYILLNLSEMPDKYVFWALTMLFLGVPIMTVVFRRVR